MAYYSKQKKSKMIKWAIGAVVAVGAIWYFFTKSSAGQALVAQAKANTTTNPA